MGHHGGGHSGMGHHGGQMGHHGVTLGGLLGLGGGHHSFLGHLFGQHGGHQHHGFHGGEPQDSASWNMAMQAEKPTLVNRLINANIGPAIILGLLMSSMIFWLWLVDFLHQHEKQKNYRQESYASQQFQSLSLSRGRAPIEEPIAPQTAPQPPNPAFGYPPQSPSPVAATQYAAPQAMAPQYSPQYSGSQYQQYAAFPVTPGVVPPAAGAAAPYESAGSARITAGPMAAAPAGFGQPGYMVPSAFSVPIQTPGGPRMRVTVNR